MIYFHALHGSYIQHWMLSWRLPLPPINPAIRAGRCSIKWSRTIWRPLCLGHWDADPTAKGFPQYVQDEFYASLQCGVLAHGFVRLGCDTCPHQTLLAFSCKQRGFCPSWLLVDALRRWRPIWWSR